MRPGRTVFAWMLVVTVTLGLIVYSGPGCSEATEPAPGVWTGGAAVGFLGNTADGTAFTANLNVERFITRNFSIGPLLQFGVTHELTQIGLSGQAKFWIHLSRGFYVTLQGGAGFVHTDFPVGDTSFLIPLGVGFDYALRRDLSVTSTFLLNLSSVQSTGGGSTNAHVSPGLTFGLRF